MDSELLFMVLEGSETFFHILRYYEVFRGVLVGLRGSKVSYRL